AGVLGRALQQTNYGGMPFEPAHQCQASGEESPVVNVVVARVQPINRDIGPMLADSLFKLVRVAVVVLVFAHFRTELPDERLQRRDEHRDDIAIEEQLNAESPSVVGLANPGVPVQQLDKWAVTGAQVGLLETFLENRTLGALNF